MPADLCFVDTSAWFGFFVPSDPANGKLTEFFTVDDRRLVTTDLVLVELLNLLRFRGQALRAELVWDWLHDPDLVALHRLDEAIFAEAWEVFRSFRDKEWSFTDCTSYCIIRAQRIPAACSVDAHFRQFGITQVFPSDVR